MSAGSSGFAGWNRYDDVDQQDQPAAFVGHMDRLAGMDAVRVYKRQTYALLQIRAGSQILDVGCGPGDDVRTMAERVGSSGSVVGIDHSQTMIDSARERSQGSDLPVEFRQGNVYALAMADGSFDGVRADRVLHHLDNPQDAVAEMARVLRPGGRAAVFEPDFEACVLDAPDAEMARRVMQAMAKRFRQSACGRQLLRWFREAGLIELTIAPFPFLWDYPTGNTVLGIESTVRALETSGDVTESESQQFLRELERENAAGSFLLMGLGFIASGRKPTQ